MLQQYFEIFFSNPSNVIAFCALLISILSFGVTIYTIWIQREHDRLSVKPLASIHVDCLTQLGKFAIKVNNDGLGPMIIKTVEMFQPIGAIMSKRQWPPVELNIVNPSKNLPQPRILFDLENHPILNGNSIVLVLLEIDPHDENQIIISKKFCEGLKDQTLKITYTDIYNNLFEVSYNLGVFGLAYNN